MKNPPLFLFLLLAVCIVLIAGCVPSQAPPEVVAELPAAPEEDAAPPALPDEKQETQQEPAAPPAPAEKETPQLAPEYATPNSVVLSEKTIIGTAYDINKKEESTSWFSDVTCGKLFADGDSLVTFTLENKGNKSYHLTRVGVEDVTEKDGLNVRLNSNRILSVPQKQCGTALLKPGQKATCTIKHQLRKGQTYWEKELINKLAATSVGFYSELKFKCEGIAE